MSTPMARKTMTAEDVGAWAKEHLDLVLADWQARWVALTLKKPEGSVSVTGQRYNDSPTLVALAAIREAQRG